MSISRLVMMASSPTFNPEEGLTLTYSHPEGLISAYTETERGQPVVMACDVTFPETPADGCLNEFGATLGGNFEGLIDSGTVFRFRAGSGSNPIDTSSGVLLDVSPLRILRYIRLFGNLLQPLQELYVHGWTVCI